MSKDLKTIDLNILPLETLKEMANEAAEQVENNAKLTVQKAADCGRYLTAIKEQLDHGQWLPWLGANWDYAHKTAARYMEIAANLSRVTNLKDASSIREALRMIADDKEEKTAPRSERKPANVVVTTPDNSGQLHLTPDNSDPDPAPNPPTNRKTAKGSENVPEDKKPRTQTVPVEIVDEEPMIDPVEEWMSHNSIDVILARWVQVVEFDGSPKQTAKQLRKLADKLDPPTKFVKPDLEDVSAYMHTLGDAIGKDTAAAAEGFIDHYQSNGWMVGKVPMKDWRATARKWLKNQGQFSGKANGNGHGRTTETNDPGSCLGPNGRPRVERAKITYK